jgi:hypothetical protein
VLSRISFIDRQIASEKYPNVNDLVRKYEVGTATIYRDIDYMGNMLGTPIEYSAKDRGWFYAEKPFCLSAHFAAVNDMLPWVWLKSCYLFTGTSRSTIFRQTAFE